MRLKKVTIHKYKCIESEQTFDIEEDITILVGMNESGKTSVLEALAKTNYFQDDKEFTFNATHDYPRKEKKTLDKSGDNPDAVTCEYSITEDIQSIIEKRVGKNIFNQKTFSITKKYDNMGENKT